MIRTGRVYTCHQGYRGRVQDERGVRRRRDCREQGGRREDEALAGQAGMPHVGEGEELSYKEQQLVEKGRRSTTRAVGERWILRA